MRQLLFAAVLTVCGLNAASAHDIWLETNTELVRVGDRVDIDFKLGNHGNEHRDFKLASKTAPDGLALEVISPAGKKYDLRPSLTDLGYTPKEGYWSAPFITAEPGHYLALSTSDKIVNHGKPLRSIRSAKVWWLADKSLDKPGAKWDANRKPLNLPFELVLLSDPVLFAGPGKAIDVQLVRSGKPAADQVVSFIPRGVELSAEFDPTYERRTDKEGKTSFTPKEGNTYLIVSHQVTDDEKGAGYEGTKYTATLTIRVPQICPCCDE
ncbi:DUF4198 domain-containing protein [Anatilimnocola floriformis]|uniref:DUF4198 domain-containing protein n=1 Tax=Anatilimnocola floriformis TaxID=2948575 RepID=UPI0020C3D32F|nr:DUF4198 domain-containing protein [Anatilimnocola floriformis]